MGVRSRALTLAAAMTLKEFLLRFATWWNGATLNTRLHPKHGESSATTSSARPITAQGGKIDPALGFERRWVI